MLAPILRNLEKGMLPAALVGFLLFKPMALAQSLNGDLRQTQYYARPQSTDGRGSQIPPPNQFPAMAQTPQSPENQSFSDLSGGSLPALPGGPSGGPSPTPMTGDYFGGMTAPTPAQPVAVTAPSTGAEAAPSFGGFGSAFAPGAFGAGGGATTAIADNVGYIDSAIIRSRVRVRFDANYNDTSPDMAEFFYAKCGCFANPKTVLNPATRSLYDPRARGPQHAVGTRGISQFSGEPRLNYQEVSTYLEYAPTRNFSAFIELPARFLQATLIRNAAGFSDLNLGTKYAFIANPNQYYTFQFRVYTPTGNSYQGLGTGHVSLEPAFLVFQRLTDRLYFSGEFRDWIPVGGSNFAGNVLRYGIGLTYNIVLTDHFRIAPVNEIVGWTVLNGKEFVATAQEPMGVVESADRWTIVNEKIGLRIGLGDYRQAGGGSGLNDRHSLYVGYGHCITGTQWYRDSFRLEYNFWF